MEASAAGGPSSPAWKRRQQYQRAQWRREEATRKLFVATAVHHSKRATILSSACTADIHDSAALRRDIAALQDRLSALARDVAALSGGLVGIRVDAALLTRDAPDAHPGGLDAHHGVHAPPRQGASQQLPRDEVPPELLASACTPPKRQQPRAPPVTARAEGHPGIAPEGQNAPTAGGGLPRGQHAYPSDPQSVVPQPWGSNIAPPRAGCCDANKGKSRLPRPAHASAIRATPLPHDAEVSDNSEIDDTIREVEDALDPSQDFIIDSWASSSMADWRTSRWSSWYST